MTNPKLVNYLIGREVLRTPEIIEAFLVVDRAFFVPKKFLEESHMNFPLPIGDGKTLMQPSSAAIMLELLEPREGDFVLEIGAGCGWMTALLSKLVSTQGAVYAYEINRVVGEFGSRNLANFFLTNFNFKVADAKRHWLENAPYNRIVSKSVLTDDEVEELTDLLAAGGILIVPTKDKDIKKITKDELGNIHERKYSSFVFVPLP